MCIFKHFLINFEQLSKFNKDNNNLFELFYQTNDIYSPIELISNYYPSKFHGTTVEIENVVYLMINITLAHQSEMLKKYLKKHKIHYNIVA